MKLKARNSANTKEYNRKLIIKMIRDERISRVDISRRTGLTRAGITLIVEDLIREGVVVEAGTTETSSGRKPVELDVNPNRYFALGLDISRDICMLGAVDFKGNELKSISFQIDSRLTPEQAIRVIVKKIKELVTSVDHDWGELLGLGINVPGPIDSSTGTILNPPNFEQWHGVNLVEKLKSKFDFKIMLENNSIGLTLGEKHYGYGMKFKSFMLVVVDAGIGAGIVLNNKIYRGVNGFGSEIGHTCIDYNGKRCSCGNVGCVEMYASIPSILEEAMVNGVHAKSWKILVDKAIKGDQKCVALIEKESQYLGVAISNIFNLLELEAVVLTGYINYKPDMLLSKVQTVVNEHIINRNRRTAPVYMSEIKADERIISAATIIMEDFFN